jgi:cystathionine beta-lyase/cystathionine gamma-synthase
MDLLRLGSEDPKTISGHQDLMLGQLLVKGKDAMKTDFLKLTMMKEESKNE